MTKKSEFAQRLLDDLRMRKERMAAGAGQSYGQSHNSMAARADAHGQSMKGQRGPRGIAKRTGTSKTDGMHRGSSSRSGSFVAENSSNQLVCFNQGHVGKKMSDPSAALDIAFKNGQKLMMDSSTNRSMLAFLQQITRGSVIDFQNSERKGNIKISTFHINEISKGAQKLNNILAACSEGINADRYSIEIGKELFRSAKDLEESLRMLIGLQEAASNMTTPQRKSRIRLLEGNEDDEDNNTSSIIESQKQIDRPRFSFDKLSSSNNARINREATNSLRQRSAALSYLTNVRILNADPSSSIMSQKQPSSYVDEYSSNTSSASDKRKETSVNTLKSEKKGLPNIIAKLMGLEEGTQHVKSKEELRTEPESKQRDGTSIKLAGGSIESNLKNKGAEVSHPQMLKTRLLQANMMPLFKGASFDIHEKQRQISCNFSQQNATQGRIKLRKEAEKAEEKSLALSETANNPNMQERKVTGLSKDQVILDKKRNFANDRKLKTSMKRVPSTPVTSTHIQSLEKRSNQTVRDILPVTEIRKESKFEMETRNSNMRLAQNQQRTQNGFGLCKRTLFGQPQTINQGYKPDKEQKSVRNRLHMKDQEGNEAVLIVSKQVSQDLSTSKKENPELTHETKQYQTEDSVSASSAVLSLVTRDCGNSDDTTSCIFTNATATDHHSDHSLFSKDQGVETELKKTGAPPLKEDKYVQVTSTMNKVPKSKEHKISSIKMTDQMKSRNQDMILPQRLNSSQEHWCAALKETEFPHDDGNNSKFIAEDSSGSGTQPLQSTTKAPKNQVENPPGPSALQISYLTDITQRTPSEASSPEHVPLYRVDNTEETISCNIQPKEVGVDRMSPDISDSLQCMAHKTHITKKPDSLMEEETQLKHILVSTQQFLNTAEALFKLGIPVNFLQTGDQELGDKKNKDILDTAYEIMKKKGRKQELNLHPFTKTLITFPKVGSLDDLVKQLCKDIETLKSYGGKWGDDTGAYLLKMVERDMYYEDPDINCMWDYGWNYSSFALAEKDNTIQELERYILDDLIDDILHDIQPSYKLALAAPV
ncbi:unnamed protein product [Rhodiola kirilowii]